MRTDRKSGMARRLIWVLLSVAIIGALALVIGGRHKKRPPLTALEEEKNLVDQVVRSGPPVGKNAAILEQNAGDVLERTFDVGVKQLAAQGRAQDFLGADRLECHSVGCTQKVHYKSAEAAEIFERGLLEGATSPLRSWPGSIYRGPLVDGDLGTVSSTWGLLINPKLYSLLPQKEKTSDTTDQPERQKSTEVVRNYEQGEQR